MEPVTIAYIFFGTLWVVGALTYLQIMAKNTTNEYFTPDKFLVPDIERLPREAPLEVKSSSLSSLTHST